MVQVIVKRKKENSKSRRCRERGEHYAAYKAACDEVRATSKRIDKAFLKLSEGCSERVFKATMSLPLRSKEQASADNICLPDVAIFAAGHRKPTETITAR